LQVSELARLRMSETLNLGDCNQKTISRSGNDDFDWLPFVVFRWLEKGGSAGFNLRFRIVFIYECDGVSR